MSGYIGTEPVPKATRVLTQGELSSSSSVIPVPGGFTPRNISVHINGIRLRESDYDDSTGSEIDLGEEFSAGTEYVIEEFRDFRVSDTDAKVGEHSDQEGGVHGIPEGERAIHSEELLTAVSEAADIDEAVSFVGKGAIVESGTNSNGSYVRWENGEQFWWIRRAQISGLGGNNHDQDFTLPAALATTDGAMAVGTLERLSTRWDSVDDRSSFISTTPRDTNVGVLLTNESGFVGDFGEINLFGTGFWK